MATALPALVYFLCFATATACAWLLGRSYARVGARLLFWSAACFGLLALQNLMLVVDLLLVPAVDLRLPRLALGLLAVGTLLFGFIWEGEEA